MREWQSMSHVRWERTYHVVFIPKYRYRVFYGKVRGHIGPRPKPESLGVRATVANGPNGAFPVSTPPSGGLPQATRSAGGT